MIKNLKNHTITKTRGGVVGDSWTSSINNNGYYRTTSKIFNGYTKKEIKAIFRKQWLEFLNN